MVLVLVLPSQGEEMEGQGRRFELCLQSETTFLPKFVGMAMPEVSAPVTHMLLEALIAVTDHRK